MPNSFKSLSTVVSDINDIKSPADEPVAEKKKFPNIFSIFRFRDTSDTILISVGVFFAICQGILPPLNMIVLGNVMNSLGYGFNSSVFDTMILNFCVLMVCGLVCGSINAGCLEVAAERQVRRLKSEYLAAVLRQDIGYFDIIDTGTLASKIEQTCVHVRDGTGLKFGLIFQFGSQFLGGYAVGLAKGWKMALVLTAVIPLLGGTMGFMITRVRKMIALSKEEYEAAGSVAEEALPVMRTVASFNAEEKIIGNFDSKLSLSVISEQKAMLYRALAMCTMMGLLFMSYALGWWYAGKAVGNAIRDSKGTDTETAGMCLTVFFSIIIASFSVGQLMPNVNSVIVGAKSIETVNVVIDRVSPIDPSKEEGLKPEQPLEGCIEFKNVKFAFPSRLEKPVYQDVSFRIEAGETVALVGPSGCGKSTIVQMIERFYDPNSGVIEIDGIDSRNYNIHWLRQNMGMVSQEPKLFAESVRKNIGYGRDNSSLEEIIESSKKANAHKFIQGFPEAYETNVGEGGSLLSGGQKQRVAIARAILRDPAILILDEATSALDNESEKIVQRALDDLIAAKKRTTIIIAHRLSTIRNVDKIIVVDNPTGYGSVVVEHGTHDELMQLDKGLYRALVTAQMAISSKDQTGSTMALDEFVKDEVVAELASEYLSGSLSPEQVQDLSHSASVAKLVKKYSKVNPSIDDDTDAHQRLESRIREASKNFEKQQKKHRFRFWKNGDAEVAAEMMGAPELADARARDLFAYMKEDWKVVAIGCFAAIFSGGAFPIISVMISKFIGVFYMPQGANYNEKADYIESRSNTLSFIFIGIAVGIALSVFIQNFCFGWTGERLVGRMRRLIFTSLMYQEMEFFDDSKNNTGYLSSVLSADCATVRGVTGDNLSIIFQNFMTFVIALIIAFISNAKLAAVCLCVYGLIVPANFIQIRNTKPAQVKPDATTDTEAAGFVLNEAITSLRTIAAYNLQSNIHQRYLEVLDREFKIGARNGVITGITSGFASGIMYAANACAFKYAGVLIDHAEPGFDIEKLMRTILALTMAGNGIGRNTAFATDSRKAKAATQNIFEILRRVPKMDVRDPSGMTKDFYGAVEFQNMKFRYPTRPETPILDDISFSVTEGETVALVGESGCGKSTIIQLLERFYDLEASKHLKLWVDKRNMFIKREAAEGRMYPPLPLADEMFNGEVLINKENIQDYNLTYLRAQLGLVSQEPALFDVSVRENIRWGKPDATDEEVEAAARIANAHNFVSELPKGYDETVGKGGMRLSGGQKQRVAIARAVIRDPKILLLDEATSALDPESEEIVQRALDELVKMQKRTTIVIAHRLTTIRNADKIVVFVPHPGEGSKIVEQGNHDDLMKLNNGVYRKLVELSQTPGSGA